MKKLLFFVLLIFFFLNSVNTVNAQSEYVLPYPSYMPGGILYKLHLAFEQLEKYWYFGNIAQFQYHLKQADKYLVEAKTLFEYKQYLLAVKALKKSDEYFKVVDFYILEAKKEGKNISEKEEMFRLAKEKHAEVLLNLMKNVPIRVLWKPEKDSPTDLDLNKIITESINLRK